MKKMRLCEKVKMICVKRVGPGLHLKTGIINYIPLDMTAMVSSLARDTNTGQVFHSPKKHSVSISWYLEVYKILGVKWEAESRQQTT